MFLILREMGGHFRTLAPRSQGSSSHLPLPPQSSVTTGTKNKNIPSLSTTSILKKTEGGRRRLPSSAKVGGDEGKELEQKCHFELGN